MSPPERPTATACSTMPVAKRPVSSLWCRTEKMVSDMQKVHILTTSMLLSGIPHFNSCSRFASQRLTRPFPRGRMRAITPEQIRTISAITSGPTSKWQGPIDGLFRRKCCVHYNETRGTSLPLFAQRPYLPFLANIYLHELEGFLTSPAICASTSRSASLDSRT